MDAEPGGSAVVILFLLLFVHAFFAAADVALASVRKSHVTHMAEDGQRRAQIILRLTRDSSRLLTTTQVVLKILGLIVFGLSLMWLREPVLTYVARLRPGWTVAGGETTFVLLLAIAVAVLLLFFGELVPKSIAVRHPDAVSSIAAYPVAALSVLVSPLLVLSGGVSRLFSDGKDDAEGSGLAFVTEEQIKTMVDAGEEGGFIQEDEKEMIYSIFDLGDTLAREVMVPRVDVVALDVNTPISEALSVVVEGGHSRIPVYEDTVDNTVGMLYAKDLLAHWPDLEDLVLQDILREVHYVPETKPVDKLLQELQQLKVHIAVVVDEYGGVAGLITIEDILEEIVGEIQDEYDSEEAAMEVVDEHEIIFNSRADLDDVNHELGIELPTDSSDTLGGLIYSSLGRVPVVGDTVRFDDAELTVLSVTGRRMHQIQVRRLGPLPPSRPRAGEVQEPYEDIADDLDSQFV